MRMGGIDIGSPVLKYTFPEWTATIFGTTPGDYNAMNNGMRYGFVWDLAPRHYNESVDEPLTRPLARYVSELIRIRKRYADLLFFGRFNDTMGATVHGGPMFATPSSNRCSRTKRRGLRGRQFRHHAANGDREPRRHLGRCEVATPFHADQRATLPAQITIAPHQLAVVVKQ